MNRVHIIRSLANYLVLVRLYSIVDLLLIFLLARAVSIGNQIFNYNDIIFGGLYLLLWLFLTLDLEAKHKHTYRAVISNKIPYLLLFVATVISAYYNIYSLIFIILIWITTNTYIKKEESKIAGSACFISRGLYETSIFLFGISLFIGLMEMTLTHFLVSLIVFLLYASRNLIGDIRDVAFDKNTFVVRYGSKMSYLLIILMYIISILLMLYIFQNFLIVIPIIIFVIILLFYDNGYNLHRCSIILTSFTSVNIISYLFSWDLFYINILFLVCISNLILYNSISRKSNPKDTVFSEVKFLFLRDKQRK